MKEIRLGRCWAGRKREGERGKTEVVELSKVYSHSWGMKTVIVGIEQWSHCPMDEDEGGQEINHTRKIISGSCLRCKLRYKNFFATFKYELYWPTMN